MCRSMSMFEFALFMVALIAASATASSGVPIGGTGGGSVILEYQPMDNNDLNINTNSASGTIVLIQGYIATVMAKLDVTASGNWKINVQDLNSGDNKGKMRKYDDGYVTPEEPLSGYFGVLVDDVGENGESGEIFDTLIDATDLSATNGVDIVLHNGDIGTKTIDLMYSQSHSTEGLGLYRIDLRYTLSAV